MKEYDTKIFVKIKKVIYDTALSNINFWYDLEENEVSNVRIWSHFMYTDKSTKKWFDDCSYGQCFYIPDNEKDWKELVECIKGEEWTWKKALMSEDEKILVGEIREKIMQQILKNLK